MEIPSQLYHDIISCMPIPCVDLMVYNFKGEILLTKRRHTPARGSWWFPGGRVLYRESRQEAVKRKLWQECALMPCAIEELGTHDLQLDRDDDLGTAHSITTVYRVGVDDPHVVQLDFQSQAARWQSGKCWLAEGLHPFVHSCLELYGQNRHG